MESKYTTEKSTKLKVCFLKNIDKIDQLYLARKIRKHKLSIKGIK